MVSNPLKILTLLFGVLHLVSCVGPDLSLSDENLIGSKLESISSLRGSSGNDSSNVVLFDPVIKKLHQFNLDQMNVVRTLDVLNADQPHYVLHDNAGNYILDLSLKHISVFDKNSNPQHNPIQFFGKPISAAFRPDLGLLVMYDDLQTAGVVKMDSNGVVQKAAVFGSIVSNDQTIATGDLLEDGNLVLGLSDQSIAEIDITQSLAQDKWVSQIHASGLTDIVWIAPVPTKPRLLLIKSKLQVSLYDLDSTSVISSLAVTGSIEKYSKVFNPHVLERIDSRTLKLIYTDGITIKTRLMNRQYKTILSSDLDLAKNIWTFVEANLYSLDPQINNTNIYKYKREIVRYRVSDMVALQSKFIPDRAEVKLANDYFFCLFPSDLGYATKNSVLTDSVSTMKNFNVKNF
jgi:hypothetical protein